MAIDYSKLSVSIDGKLIVKDGKLAYRDCAVAYRQARDCNDHSLADVWMADGDATAIGTDSFRLHLGDERCYYFDFSDAESDSPGTVYTSSEVEIQGDGCDNCTCAFYTGAIVIFMDGSDATLCCMDVFRPDGSDGHAYRLQGAASALAGRMTLLLGNGTGDVFNGINTADPVAFDQFAAVGTADCSTPSGSGSFGVLYELNDGPPGGGVGGGTDIGLSCLLWDLAFLNTMGNVASLTGMRAPDPGGWPREFTMDGQYAACDSPSFVTAVVGTGSGSLSAIVIMMCTVIVLDWTGVPDHHPDETGVSLSPPTSGGTYTIGFTATGGSRSWYARPRTPGGEMADYAVVSWARITGAAQGVGDSSITIVVDAYSGAHSGDFREAYFQVQDQIISILQTQP